VLDGFEEFIISYGWQHRQRFSFAHLFQLLAFVRQQARLQLSQQWGAGFHPQWLHVLRMAANVL